MELDPHRFFIRAYSFILLFSIFVPGKEIIAQQSNLSKAVNYLSSFIASDYFQKLSTTNDDLALVDTLYLRAVKFEDYDYSDALFVLTFTTIPYRVVPIKFPLLPLLHFPLTSASDSIYKLKNKNLPKLIYFDSPENNFGDKDKLAHFFGSAFLSYTSNIFDLGDLIGYFVEAFEQNFKVQSLIDPRDLQTDTIGNIFGEFLKKDKNILPSQILIIRSLLFFRYHL